ncbi:MAG: 7TM diverse intracellular signaling domain-containing protein, partial [Candidatus Krumholzibacteria bacterium]
MKPRSLILVALCAAAAFVPNPARGSDRATDAPPAVRLENGWQYRWGDSPVDSTGAFTWLHETTGDGWQDIDAFVTPPDAGDQTFVWYKITLPETRWQNPSLSFPTLAMAVEVYVGGTRIYKYGDMEWSSDTKYAAVVTHLFPIEYDYPGKTMMVRIYSRDASYIGAEHAHDWVWIGSASDLVGHIFRHSLDSTILGCLFIFTGMFSLMLGRFRERAYFPFSFGAFALLIGLFYVFSDPLALFLIKSPVAKLYTRFISFLLFPVGLYAFLGHIVGARWVTRVLWLAHLAFAVAVLSLDLLGVVALPLVGQVFSFFFAGTIVVALFTALTSAIGGNRDAKIFIWGFTILGLTGLHDILMGMGNIAYWHSLSHWGTLVFLVSLAYIMERRFTENHRRLKVYSRELEDKSEQLEEHSRTLEQKVTERTRDLDEKNRAIEETLRELKQAQQQLI